MVQTRCPSPQLLGDITLYSPNVQTENCALAVLSLGAGGQVDQMGYVCVST